MDEEIKIEGNLDINEALEEFEIKSQDEQTQKTSEVLKTSEIPKMVKLVMKYSGGAIKEQRTAEYVLFGFVVLAIGVSLYLFFGGGGGGKTVEFSTKVQQDMQKAAEDLLRH